MASPPWEPPAPPARYAPAPALADIFSGEPGGGPAGGAPGGREGARGPQCHQEHQPRGPPHEVAFLKFIFLVFT